MSEDWPYSEDFQRVDITAPPSVPKRYQLILPPNDPQALCMKCGGENIQIVYHALAMAVFNGEVFPCSHYPLGSLHVSLGEHLCKRCSTCGFRWMEEVAEAGPDYSVVELPEDEIYPELEQGEGGEMAIRKTGSASGEITGIDSDETGLVKEGAARPDWDDQDEAGLAAENDSADKDE